MTCTLFDRRENPYTQHTCTGGVRVSEILEQFPGSTSLFSCGPTGEVLRGRRMSRGEVVDDGGHYALVYGATDSLIAGGASGDTGRGSRDFAPRQPNIIVPVDTSKPSRWALRWAARLARETQERPALTVFHAVDASIVVAWEGQKSAAVEHFREKAAKVIDQVIEAVASDLGGIEVGRAAVVGNPADAIVEASLDFDLVVMGTHARSGVKHFFLGSVCESVMRHSVVPVFTVKYDAPRGIAPEDAPAPPSDTSGPVLVPVPDHHDPQLLASSVIVARLLGTPICFVHVAGADAPRDPDRLAKAERIVDWYVSSTRSKSGGDVSASGEVTWNSSPAAAIIALAESSGFKMVVIGTHGRSGLDRIAVGSVCEKVVRTCKVPVVVVGTGKAHPLESSQGFVAFETTKLPLPNTG